MGKVVGSLLSGLVLLAISFWLQHPEQIERRTAKEFLEQYYSQVVKADGRDRTWEMLTPAFRDSKVDRKGYEAFWREIRQVRVGAVDHVSGEQNRFLTKLTYVRRDGRVSRPQKTAFVLICDSWVSKNPVQDCGPGDLRIDDATLPDKLANLF